MTVLHIAVIDHGYGCECSPTVITAPSRTALNKALMTILGLNVHQDPELSAFLAINPPPLAGKASRASRWLIELREQLTAPWITTYTTERDGRTRRAADDR